MTLSTAWAATISKSRTNAILSDTRSKFDHIWTISDQNWRTSDHNRRTSDQSARGILWDAKLGVLSSSATGRRQLHATESG